MKYLKTIVFQRERKSLGCRKKIDWLFLATVLKAWIWTVEVVGQKTIHSIKELQKIYRKKKNRRKKKLRKKAKHMESNEIKRKKSFILLVYNKKQVLKRSVHCEVSRIAETIVDLLQPT